MKSLKLYLIVFVVLAIAAVVIPYFIWLSYPKTYLNVLVLDKTVKDFNYDKHRSLFWVLNNARIVKSDGSSYDYDEDYYGFHPLSPESSRQYEIRRITLEHIDSITNASDMLYCTDTYGVYFSEWFRGFKQSSENSYIDGGLSQNDYLLLKNMKEKGKLIISEFNTIQQPTSELIKFKTANLFGINNIQWYGCYFETLDTLENEELPYWVVARYKENNNDQWPFNGAGIVFVSSTNVFVMESKKHLIADIPVISPSIDAQARYQLPMNIEYTNWFEVAEPADTMDILAKYQLNATESGDSLLKANGINSTTFPAIMAYNKNNIHVFYFAGDFATNPVTSFYAKIANSRKFLNWFTGNKKKQFFQKMYFPLMENIMLKYAEKNLK